MPNDDKARSPQNTTVTISLPKELRARIEKAAAEDKRKLSDWMRVNAEEILDLRDAVKAKAAEEALAAAQPPPAKKVATMIRTLPDVKGAKSQKKK